MSLPETQHKPALSYSFIFGPILTLKTDLLTNKFYLVEFSYITLVTFI